VRRLVTVGSAVPDVLVAAIVGDAGRLAELLKADPVAVKARTGDGLTPLHLAAREGHEKAVGVLLANGADVNAVDVPTREFTSPDGYTPLHLAVLAGRPVVVKVLLAKGADANAADANGRLTPLHYAAWGGNADLVRALLAGKADRGAKDEKGRIPIDLAKERKHAELVKLLEEK
jgi:ankyrin repeat protein